MAVGMRECILLGVAWSKVPHKLDIPCQPMVKRIQVT